MEKCNKSTKNNLQNKRFSLITNYKYIHTHTFITKSQQKN